MTETVYVLSLLVICVIATAATLHPDVHVGVSGNLALCALTLSSIGAMGTDDPAFSTVALAVSAAGVALWLAITWAWRRRCMARRSSDFRRRAR